MPESAEAPSAYVEAAMVREEAIRACGPAADAGVTLTPGEPYQVAFPTPDVPEDVRVCLADALLHVDWPKGSQPFSLLVSFDDGPLARDTLLLLGALDRVVIDATIKTHMTDLRDCYQAVLSPQMFAKQPGGRIVVRFTIGVDGSVTDAAIKSREWTIGRKPAPSDGIEACMLHEFRGMVFPEPRGGGVVIVSYPFQFSPG